MKKIKIEFDKSIESNLIKVIANEDCDEIRKIENLFNYSNTDYLIGYKNNQYYNIPIENIYKIFCKNSSVFIKVEKQEFEIRERLYEVEKKLLNFSFVKINQSEIINLKKVLKFDLSLTAKINVVLKNGDILSVSRRNMKKIKKIIGVKK